MVASAPAPEAAYRILGRATYGARPKDADQLARMGVSAWTDRQLAMKGDDPALVARLAELRIPIRVTNADGQQVEELRPLTRLNATQAENFALWDRPDHRVPVAEGERVRTELQLATVVRKAASEAQLYEKLVEFWHDHFSVNAQANQLIKLSIVEHDRRIRAHALGNFRDMLEAVASSPAMLYYLTNFSSRAGAPNENYGRELMELHTLGRPAYFGAARTARDVPRDAAGYPTGYVDADVWEAARAFTGWSVAAGQGIDQAQRLPRTGEFIYVEAWHDPYQKRFLGRDLDPFAPALAHGRKVLDIVATHPATARFVCGKLVRFLIGDPMPPAAVDRAAAAFLRTASQPDQIAETVRAIMAGPEIAEATTSRARRPLDAVAAAVRGLDLPFTPNMALVAQIGASGQALFNWPSPDGQPLEALYYEGAGPLRSRWAMLVGLARNAMGAGLSPLYAELAGGPVGPVAGRLARVTIGPAGRAVAQTVAEIWGRSGRSDSLSPSEVAEVAGWVLTAPAFQRA